LLSEPQIQTNSKGKPTSVIHEDIEYVCIPLSQFDRVAADFINTVDKSMESPIRTSFASGYRFALERLGMVYFGDIPEVPRFPHENKIRKQIKIAGDTYYEDEVLERLGKLPTTQSIWRK
jgi:hypothetical protein